ncbi:hypothetical protein ACXWTF_12665 [Thiomicrolovo sp. ZZH C-3]
METFGASVHYDDLKGSVAMDEAHNKGIHEFAKENGIDTTRYFPIAIDIWSSEQRLDITVVTIDVEAEGIGAGEYDTVKSYIDAADPVIVKRFDTDATLADFLKHWKLFNLFATKIDGLEGKTYTQR